MRQLYQSSADTLDLLFNYSPNRAKRPSRNRFPQQNTLEPWSQSQNFNEQLERYMRTEKISALRSRTQNQLEKQIILAKNQLPREPSPDRLPLLDFRLRPVRHLSVTPPPQMKYQPLSAARNHKQSQPGEHTERHSKKEPNRGSVQFTKFPELTQTKRSASLPNIIKVEFSEGNVGRVNLKEAVDFYIMRIDEYTHNKKKKDRISRKYQQP